MSLIVANATESSLFLVADTMLTRKHKVTNPYVEGGVKIAIIDDNRCIAFAGLYEPAQEVIRNIKKTDKDDAIVRALMHATTINDIEFIFATIIPIPNLIKISNGIILSCKTAWIGDYEGFSLYQSFFVGSNCPETIHSELTNVKIKTLPEGCPEADVDLYVKMFECMNAVVDSTEVDTVRGFVVPVITSNGVLQFGCYLSIFRRPLDLYEFGGKDEGPIPFGDASMGSFSINFADMNRRKIAVHINQGRLGIIFDSSDNFVLEPEILTNIDEIDFSAVIKERFNHTLCAGIASSPGDYFVKAEVSMKNKDFAKAMLLLTEGIKGSSKNWKDRTAKPQFCYESLSECLENEGPPLQIPTEEISNLKLAFLWRGICHYDNKNFQKALKDFNETLVLDNQYYDAFLWRARVEYQLGENLKAIKTMKKCCEIHSTEEGFTFCGNLLKSVNEDSEAEHYFRKALGLRF